MAKIFSLSRTFFGKWTVIGLDPSLPACWVVFGSGLSGGGALRRVLPPASAKALARSGFLVLTGFLPLRPGVYKSPYILVDLADVLSRFTAGVMFQRR